MNIQTYSYTQTLHMNIQTYSYTYLQVVHGAVFAGVLSHALLVPLGSQFDVWALFSLLFASLSERATNKLHQHPIKPLTPL